MKFKNRTQKEKFKSLKFIELLHLITSSEIKKDIKYLKSELKTNFKTKVRL